MARESGWRRLLAAARTLGADLLTATADPLPRMSGPRWLAWLPHALIVLLAAYLFDSNADELVNTYQLGTVIGSLLTVIQSAALVAAMFRPMLAWWATTIVMVIAAQAAESEVAVSAAFPWTYDGIVLQTAVLFLLALRVRPRVAVVALTISVLAGLACATLFISQAHRSDAEIAVPAFVAATVVGAALRVSRVARTQLVEQQVLTAEERAQRTLLEERSRIARELHDVVAHHLSVISIQAQVAPHLVDDPPEELTQNLAGIRENAVEGLTELRRVLGVLRSDTLSEGSPHSPQPTLERLDELIANVRGAGLAVTTEITGRPRPLSPGVELSAFRIVQEALSNAIRHAPGATVRVSITYHPTSLTVRIVNTAPTRPAPPSQGDRHGLLGMGERTAMLSGELTTGATPDGGYEVTAVLPAPGPAPAADPAGDTA